MEVAQGSRRIEGNRGEAISDRASVTERPFPTHLFTVSHYKSVVFVVESHIAREVLHEKRPQFLVFYPLILDQSQTSEKPSGIGIHHKRGFPGGI